MREKRFGGRYRIRGLIGEGGMASVYVAVDETLDRKVAIKIMHSRLSKDAGLRERFRLEAKTLSGIDHPNIVRIYDYSGDESNQLWIVTEILRGSNLAQYIEKRGKQYLHHVVATLIVTEVAKALAHAHSKGVIHRDIKPENIMILEDGRIKIVDFGIAKDTNRNNMTITGTFMGSPSYMPPEQIRGAETNFKSDIYSLSIMYYEITTGHLPFTGNSTPEIINKIMEAKYIEPIQLKSSIPEIVNLLICRGMQSDPSNRFRDIAEMKASLQQYLDRTGFEESHLELERMFRNRHSFDKKLRNSSGRENNSPPPNISSFRDINKKTPRLHGPNPSLNLKNQAEKLGVNLTHPHKKTPKTTNFRQTERRNERRPEYSVSRPPNKSSFYLMSTILTLAVLGLSIILFNTIIKKLDRTSKRNEAKSKYLRNKPSRPRFQDSTQKNRYHRVSIQSSPSARLVIDSTFVGNTDKPSIKSGILLAEGHHEIRLDRPGFVTIVQQIFVTSKTKSIKFQLEKQSGKALLNIQSNKVPTKIILRKENREKVYLMNTTSKIVRIELGDYRIEARYKNQIIKKSISFSSKGQIESFSAIFTEDP